MEEVGKALTSSHAFNAASSEERSVSSEDSSTEVDLSDEEGRDSRLSFHSLPASDGRPLSARSTPLFNSANSVVSAGRKLSSAPHISSKIVKREKSGEGKKGSKGSKRKKEKDKEKEREKNKEKEKDKSSDSSSLFKSSQKRSKKTKHQSAEGKEDVVARASTTPRSLKNGKGDLSPTLARHHVSSPRPDRKKKKKSRKNQKTARENEEEGGDEEEEASADDENPNSLSLRNRSSSDVPVSLRYLALRSPRSSHFKPAGERLNWEPSTSSSSILPQRANGAPVHRILSSQGCCSGE